MTQNRNVADTVFPIQQGQDDFQAGRIAKGADQGCIACHQSAPGGDYLYVTDTLR